MKVAVRFKCTNCSEWHEGVPGWSYPFPLPYFDVPERERKQRCFLSPDLCVVDDKRYFLRGCLELPVSEHSDILVIGVWAEINRDNFFEYQDLLSVEDTRKFGPYFGTLSAPIPTFPNTEGLKVSVWLNDKAMRPTLRVEEAEHELGIEQRDGLSLERLQLIYTYFERLRADG